MLFFQRLGAFILLCFVCIQAQMANPQNPSSSCAKFVWVRLQIGPRNSVFFLGDVEAEPVPSWTCRVFFSFGTFNVLRQSPSNNSQNRPNHSCNGLVCFYYLSSWRRMKIVSRGLPSPCCLPLLDRTELPVQCYPSRSGTWGPSRELACW